MDGPTPDLTLFGFALAAVVHAGFAVHLVRAGYWRSANGAAGRAFLGAILATAGWAAVSAYEPWSRYAAPAYVAAALDIARYALWFAFVLLLLKPAGDEPSRWYGSVPLLSVGVAITLLAGVVLVYRVLTGRYEADGSRLVVGTSLALALMGLVLVEQLFRNLPEDSRWNAKPVCLGLALVFAFDLYLYTEGVLFGSLDADAASIRGVVPLLALPLLVVASRRRSDWIRRLQVSRSAAFYSATLLLAGGYLLFMSAVGYYVRYFGGSWGRALQLALLVAGIALLAVLLLSGSLRARLRVFVGKNFFSYRYDYREEWLRFTAMLSSRSSPQEVGNLVVRGLANMVESPAGSLWTRAGVDSGPPAVGALEHASAGRPGARGFTVLLVPARAGLGHRHRRVPQRPAPLRAAGAAVLVAGEP